MHSLSTSVKLPKINSVSRKKILITEPDGEGFCQEQVDRINHEIYLQKQNILKPWEKNIYTNIYTNDGKTNHQLLNSIQLSTKPRKTIDPEMKNYRYYYKDDQLNNINDSLQISSQIKMNSEVKQKIKEPLIDIKTYINNQKKICLKNMLLELVQKERKKIENKQNGYEKSLKYEQNSLEIDMKMFENFSSHDISKQMYNEKVINHLKMGNKYLLDIYKKLSLEYHASKSEIRRVLKCICDLKTYAGFVHKLFLGNSKNFTNDLNYVNFQSLTDDEIDDLTADIMEELGEIGGINDKKLVDFNELLNDPNNLEVVFKIMEENIVQILAEKEKIEKEFMDIVEKHNNEKNELIIRLNEIEKEYYDILQDLKTFKRNSANIFIDSETINYDHYMKMLLLDIKQSVIVDNDIKKNIDEYNINTEIINPIVKKIHIKEKKIDTLIKELEECHQENKLIFNAAVTKIKNENKMIKYHLEIKKRDQENYERNVKIMEKAARVPLIGRYRYQLPFPSVKVKRKKDLSLDNENNDYALLYY